MIEFTKGKWVFWKNKKYPYWYVGKEGSERYIATVDKEANARLIAAAPEMYEMLKVCAKTEEPGNYVSAFLDLKDKARELLAHIDVEEDKHD